MSSKISHYLTIPFSDLYESDYFFKTRHTFKSNMSHIYRLQFVTDLIKDCTILIQSMIHTETEMQMIATKYYVTNVNAYKKGTILEKNVPFYNIKYILHIAETLL